MDPERRSDPPGWGAPDGWAGARGPSVPGHRPYGDSVVGVVGVALVDRLASPTRLLAARRRDRPAPEGWELPGGKVEPGESWVAAAHRELVEELEVTVRLGAFLPGPAYGGLWSLGPRHAMAVWLGEIAEGTPVAGHAHDELRWVAPGDIGLLTWLPGDVPVVRALAAWLAPGADAGASPRA